MHVLVKIKIHIFQIKYIHGFIIVYHREVFRNVVLVVILDHDKYIIAFPYFVLKKVFNFNCRPVINFGL